MYRLGEEKDKPHRQGVLTSVPASQGPSRPLSQKNKDMMEYASLVRALPATTTATYLYIL